MTCTALPFVRWASCKDRQLKVAVHSHVVTLTPDLMSTYPVQQDGDSALRVKSSLFTSQLRDLSHEHDDFANKVVKIGSSDARG